MTAESQHNGIILVLGTGLIKGAAALGVAQVLRREQIPIRRIIASSAGAVYAAAISYDYPIEQTQRFVTELAACYRNSRLSPHRRLQMMLPRMFGFNETFGLADNTKFVALFQRWLGDKTLQEAKIPLSVAATNFANGEQVIMKEGLAWQAVCATCSLPGLFPPLNINGQLLLDGAISEPLPLSLAMELRPPVIVTVGFENSELTQVATLLDYMNKLRNMLINDLLNAQLALNTLMADCEIVPITPEFGVMFEQLDAHMLPLVIEKGAEASQTSVAYIKTLLDHQPTEATQHGLRNQQL